MRLIDADRLLLNRPEYRNPIHEKNGEYNRGWNDCINAFYDIINNHPTAYDVNKVVEELWETYGDNRISNAINIVKRGGV